MMPRKKRLTIMISAIVFTILVIIGILLFVYLKTDAFKSNQTLFAKYLLQDFDVIYNLKPTEPEEIQNNLNNNKYTSDIKGKIQYTQNIGTSDENKNSPINNVQLKIKGQTDKQNNYKYKDISLTQDDENLMRVEYVNEDETCGIRLDGIKQFVSNKDSDFAELSQKLNLYNIEGLLEEIDLDSIFNFTDEEKTNIKNTYLGIIQSNITKDKYYKQSNTLITVNNQDVQANAYSIKMTIEEYNNLYIKVLQKMTNDENILTKIDNLEKIIKEKYNTDKEDGYLRKEFIDKLNETIEKIKSNNIGQDEVKITVYESNRKTIRTTIEKSKEKIMLDVYNDNNSIKIDKTELGDTENEEIFKIEKNIETEKGKTFIEYEKIINNEINNNIQLTLDQKIENSKVTKIGRLEISNEKYDAILNIEDNIVIVNQFENQVKLADDNITLNDLDNDKITTIQNILNKNMEEQLEKLNSKVTLRDYINMLQNINVLKPDSIQISDDVKVTEIEKNRFNSQYEFFVSDNLNQDNIKELLEVAKNSFGDMKVVLKNGDTEDLDIDKLSDSNYSIKTDYKKSIDEIDIFIKRNSSNEKKQEDIITLLKENNNNVKYNVSLDYNDNTGLVEKIKIKIVE